MGNFSFFKKLIFFFQSSHSILLLLLLFSFLGFFDAFYLTFSYYRNSVPLCLINSGCGNVLNSAYSKIFGIPLSLIGMAYYLTIFVLVFLVHYKRFLTKLIFVLIGMGFFASLGLVYLQFFVIKNICFYCLISAALSIFLFFLGLQLRKISKRN